MALVHLIGAAFAQDGPPGGVERLGASGLAYAFAPTDAGPWRDKARAHHAAVRSLSRDRSFLPARLGEARTVEEEVRRLDADAAALEARLSAYGMMAELTIKPLPAGRPEADGRTYLRAMAGASAEADARRERAGALAADAVADGRARRLAPAAPATLLVARGDAAELKRALLTETEGWAVVTGPWPPYAVGIARARQGRVAA